MDKPEDTYPTSKIYQAAEAVREFLPILVPKVHQVVDNELGMLLNNAKAGNDVEIEVLDLLNEHGQTRGWLQDWLSGQDASSTTRGFSSLPGDSTTSISGIKLYRCPVDGCIEKWFMYRVGQKVPQCPKHPESTFVEATTA